MVRCKNREESDLQSTVMRRAVVFVLQVSNSSRGSRDQCGWETRGADVIYKSTDLVLRPAARSFDMSRARQLRKDALKERPAFIPRTRTLPHSLYV